MLVLFSIAMLCFLALFGMLVILLRQAKAEGARERQHMDRQQTGRQRHELAASDTHAQFGVSQFGLPQSGLDLTLSNLVPAKQPDWRFMVRENRRSKRSDVPSFRKLPQAAPASLRADRAYFNEDLGDLTDPQSSQSNIARRA